MDMAEALNVLMRWVHLTSAVTLIGGMLYGWLAASPALSTLARDGAESAEATAAGRFRPLVIAAIASFLVSGIYNLLTGPSHTFRYHLLLGIKLLLAAHVFAVSVLAVREKNPRRTRMMAGAAISGLIIIAISAYLRRIY